MLVVRRASFHGSFTKKTEKVLCTVYITGIECFMLLSYIQILLPLKSIQQNASESLVKIKLEASKNFLQDVFGSGA
jgi:hypothetical protein